MRRVVVVVLMRVVRYKRRDGGLETYLPACKKRHYNKVGRSKIKRITKVSMAWLKAMDGEIRTKKKTIVKLSIPFPLANTDYKVYCNLRALLCSDILFPTIYTHVSSFPCFFDMQ